MYVYVAFSCASSVVTMLVYKTTKRSRSLLLC